jgi:hypothetical protein
LGVSTGLELWYRGISDPKASLRSFASQQLTEWDWDWLGDFEA